MCWWWTTGKRIHTGKSLYGHVDEVCGGENFAVIVTAANGEKGGGKIVVFMIALGSWAYVRPGDHCGDLDAGRGDGCIHLCPYRKAGYVPGLVRCGERTSLCLLWSLKAGKRRGGQGYVYVAWSGRGHEIVAVC